MAQDGGAPPPPPPPPAAAAGDRTKHQRHPIHSRARILEEGEDKDKHYTEVKGTGNKSFRKLNDEPHKTFEHALLDLELANGAEKPYLFNEQTWPNVMNKLVEKEKRAAAARGEPLTVLEKNRASEQKRKREQKRKKFGNAYQTSPAPPPGPAAAAAAAGGGREWSPRWKHARLDAGESVAPPPAMRQIGPGGQTGFGERGYWQPPPPPRMQLGMAPIHHASGGFGHSHHHYPGPMQGDWSQLAAGQQGGLLQGPHPPFGAPPPFTNQSLNNPTAMCEEEDSMGTPKAPGEHDPELEAAVNLMWGLGGSAAEARANEDEHDNINEQGGTVDMEVQRTRRRQRSSNDGWEDMPGTASDDDAGNAAKDHQAARGSPTPLPAHTDAPQNKTQQPAEHAPSTAMQGHAGPLEVNLTPTAAALLQQLAAQMQALAQGLATERNQATEQAQATQQQLATQIQALEQQLNQQQQTLQAAPQVSGDAAAEQTQATLALTAQLQALAQQLADHQQALEAAVQAAGNLRQEDGQEGYDDGQYEGQGVGEYDEEDGQQQQDYGDKADGYEGEGGLEEGQQPEDEGGYDEEEGEQQGGSQEWGQGEGQQQAEYEVGYEEQQQEDEDGQQPGFLGGSFLGQEDQSQDTPCRDQDRPSWEMYGQ